MIVVFGWIVQTMNMARTPEFTREEYRLGRYLRNRLQQDAARRPSILIDTPDWSYLNIVIAANAPGRCINNRGFDPFAPEEPLVRTDAPVDPSVLRAKGIRWMVFKSKPVLSDTTNTVLNEAMTGGAWTIYEVRAK